MSVFFLQTHVVLLSLSPAGAASEGRLVRSH